VLNTSRLSVDAYKKGILAGDRTVLAKAITLMESTLPGDQQHAGEVLDAVIARAGKSLRIGITGAPGVGKSTFIESFGKIILQSGKSLAVLTIDPSSQVTGGSILGDKTRMQELSKDPRAFIRPSPAGPTLGGVALHTRETILLCEAAGFEIIIVETVGTGQSEITLKGLVDFFLLLMQPGSGDELQGIKKGIVEMADAIAITKADGENVKSAKATQSDFQHALHLTQSQPSGWTVKVVTCSALHVQGITEIRDLIEDFTKVVSTSGFLDANRRAQEISWFREHFRYLLSVDPKTFEDVTIAENKLQNLLQSGKLSAREAARQLLSAYHQAIRKSS
jgi:LAO/AO transport system kinase